MKEEFKERQLISQFMGGEADTHVLTPFEYWSGEQLPFTGDYFNSDEDAENEALMEAEEFGQTLNTYVQSYHNNWDMLIPVAERCIAELSDDREGTTHSHRLNDSILTLNIKEVYNAVLTCIEHLNESKS